jgi:glutathione S-transferase
LEEIALKLFNLALSPYAARCRIQIQAKGLAVELAEPPGGLGSAEYRAINPTGRVPALLLDDAARTVLPESDVICEYLEDRFPEPALRPRDELERARMRLISRFVDLYLAPGLSPLFAQVNPKTRDPGALAEGLEQVRPLFELLGQFLAPGPFACGESLSLADCALLPFFHFAVRGFPMLGEKEPSIGRPKLAAWWDAVGRHPAVATVQAELDAALAEYVASFG